MSVLQGEVISGTGTVVCCEGPDSSQYQTQTLQLCEEGEKITSYIRGANISQLAVLVNFAENNFVCSPQWLVFRIQPQAINCLTVGSYLIVPYVHVYSTDFTVVL